MEKPWKTTEIRSLGRLFDVLLELQGHRWLCRGHSSCHHRLTPSIDRRPYAGLPRSVKLRYERQAIDRFRATAHFFSSDGERGALIDDFIALMVLRTYGVRTRLLDWSASPFVAAYFLSGDDPADDGELWAFSYREYAIRGREQWRRWPETTTDSSGDPYHFDAGLTAFRVDQPPPWIVALFYPPGFPRQNAQRGAYTMTARFNYHHDAAIRKLLIDDSLFHRYLVSAPLKTRLRDALRVRHNIWHGTLFPDTAGAAEEASRAFAR